jgi:hypothetical protein
LRKSGATALAGQAYARVARAFLAGVRRNGEFRRNSNPLLSTHADLNGQLLDNSLAKELRSGKKIFEKFQKIRFHSSNVRKH